MTRNRKKRCVKQTSLYLLSSHGIKDSKCDSVLSNIKQATNVLQTDYIVIVLLIKMCFVLSK